VLLLTVDSGPPETQFQCDLNKPPMAGFAIGPEGSILYQGSADFYACPATDTEYNVYVHPDFGQSKCFPISLKASDCGVPSPSSTSASTCVPQSTTLWQTQTIVQNVTKTVTVAQTIDATCSTSTIPTHTQCASCSKNNKSVVLSGRDVAETSQEL
jgi:hypothetical protein